MPTAGSGPDVAGCSRPISHPPHSNTLPPDYTSHLPVFLAHYDPISLAWGTRSPARRMLPLLERRSAVPRFSLLELYRLLRHRPRLVSTMWSWGNTAYGA